MRLALIFAVLLALAAPATASAEPAISIAGPSEVQESAGTIELEVTLTGPTTEPARVSWRTDAPFVFIADAPMATPGVSHVAASGTLEFAPGEASTKKVAVTLLDDAVDDPSPYLIVELHDPQGAGLGQRYLQIAIHDDEPTPPASVTGVRVAEDAGEAVLPVTRPAVSLLGHARYGWTAVPGSATPVQDYGLATGRVSIGYGKLDDVIRIPIVDDDRSEGDEQFTVRLAGDATGFPPFGGGFPGPVATDVATVTIADDEPPPVAAIAPVRGRVRVGGRRLTASEQAPRGARVDARRGAARITMPGRGTATITAGAVRLGAPGELVLVSRRIVIRATGAVTLRGRAVKTAARSAVARWTLRELPEGTFVRVNSGRVKAGAFVLPTGQARLFPRR